MPFAVPMLAAIGGGSAAAGAVGLAGTAASAYGAIKGAQNAKGTLGAAANASQIDIDQLNSQIKAIATQNAKDSLALEQQLNPQANAIRNASETGILSGLRPNEQDNEIQQALRAKLGFSSISPLLAQAALRAQTELALGGKLGIDQQNLVTRSALAGAGSVASGAGLGLGRDLTARDLGLTSLDLSNSRLANATSLGDMLTRAHAGDAGIQMNAAGMLHSMSDADFQRQLAAANFGQSIQLPKVGVDPASAADIAIANSGNRSAYLSNLAGVQGNQANGLLGIAGNLAGGLMGRYTNQAVNPSTIKVGAVSANQPMGGGYNFLSGATPFKFNP